MSYVRCAAARAAGEIYRWDGNAGAVNGIRREGPTVQIGGNLGAYGVDVVCVRSAAYVAGDRRGGGGALRRLTRRWRVSCFIIEEMRPQFPATT